MLSRLLFLKIWLTKPLSCSAVLPRTNAILHYNNTTRQSLSCQLQRHVMCIAILLYLTQANFQLNPGLALFYRLYLIYMNYYLNPLFLNQVSVPCCFIILSLSIAYIWCSRLLAHLSVIAHGNWSQSEQYEKPLVLMQHSYISQSVVQHSFGFCLQPSQWIVFKSNFWFRQ